MNTTKSAIWCFVFSLPANLYLWIFCIIGQTNTRPPGTRSGLPRQHPATENNLTIRTTPGPPPDHHLDHHWTTHGPHPDHPRTTTGPPPDHPRTTPGPPPDHPDHLDHPDHSKTEPSRYCRTGEFGLAVVRYNYIPTTKIFKYLDPVFFNVLLTMCTCKWRHLVHKYTLNKPTMGILLPKML